MMTEVLAHTHLPSSAPKYLGGAGAEPPLTATRESAAQDSDQAPQT